VRIGIDATSLSVPRAGVGTYTANLIRALRELGTDEIVPLLQREAHPSFADDVAAGVIPGNENGARWRLNRTVWMQTTLPRRITAGSFDVCHFTNCVAPLRCASPYVVTIHDAGIWRHPEYHYLRRIATLRPLIPGAVRRAAAVVTVSHSVQRELVEILRVPEDLVRVIHPGVPRRFARRPSAEELDRTRRTHDLPERFILAVGALEPRKNLTRLVEAYASLVAEPWCQDVGLVVVGPPGWKNAPLLEAMARVKPPARVIRLGLVSTDVLVSLYHLATVVAFPSLYEGFGLPVAEAMTCGTPVVTSGVGALAEVAGQAAQLVDPLHVESIADGLRRVIDDDGLAAELRRRGLERARSFTWTRAAGEMRELYSEVAGEGGAAPFVAALPDGPAGADRSVALERAILKTVAYADVFDYPLTAEEVHRYLIGVGASAAEVADALADGSLAAGRLAGLDGLVALPGREAIAALRHSRAAVAARLWPKAIRYGRLIGRLPFVRMVAVSGSLAANNVRPGADVDYLIVTAPRRLWLCRAMVILVVRWARRRGLELCPNYLLSESALELRERDLYTAWELAQVVPVVGFETYRALRRRNGWTSSFLPNAGAPPHIPPAVGRGPTRGRRGLAVRLSEGVLGGVIGDWLERWEMTRKVRRLSGEAAAGDEGARSEADFCADWCKGHLGTHRQEVLVRYGGRLADLGAEVEA
jgi:glycosyltransferase involved in cell wall biosynthesis